VPYGGKQHLTWIDIFPIVLLLFYVVLGYFAGLIRRFIGLVALFVACWAATNMGIQAGGILQQTSSMEIADGRIYGFFGILAALLIMVEVATQLAHSQLRLPAVTLDRSLGLALGVLTAVLLSVVVVYELGAAANPIGGTQLDQLQAGIRDARNHSAYAVNLVNAIDKPIIAIFGPFLPGDPQVYFGSSPVS
jgi:uncharacterized membrane protein required for colicin V production